VLPDIASAFRKRSGTSRRAERRPRRRFDTSVRRFAPKRARLRRRLRAISVAGMLVVVLAVGPGVARRVGRPAPAAPRTPQTAPTARVGAFYFDGWSGPLSSFHFDGLAHPGPLGYFPGRRPLSGWRDNTPQSLEAQLRWAHADGISFFIFDWYSAADRSSLVLNTAHDNYLALFDHAGVGYALAYVNQDPFVVQPPLWASVVKGWVTNDFVNPNYVRIAGKPLLVILDAALFTRQMGGSSGVNAAIETLQASAREHGLPGVFVVDGHQEPAEYTQDCFLNCGYDGDLLSQHWDALSKYTFNQDVKPRDGAIRFSELAAAQEAIWQRYAQQSTFRFIPSVPAGWDERSSNELVRDSSGTPRLFWFTRTPDQVGRLLQDAVNWVNANPGMRVEPAPAPPVVLIEAWNELQEGAYVVPTDEDGDAYGQAIAQAVGIPWAAPPRHTLGVAPSAGGTVTSTPSGIACPTTCSAGFDEGLEISLTASPRPGYVLDGWTGCTAEGASCSLVLVADSRARPLLTRALQRRAVSLQLSGHLAARGRIRVLDGYPDCAAYEPVEIQRRRRSSWTTIGSTQTNQLGAYSVRVPNRSTAYRAHAPRGSSGDHTCLTTSSQPIASR
jgi:hypothetical protein